MTIRLYSFSLEARQDLRAIFNYIAEDNPARAISFIEELRDCCQRAAYFPMLGPACPEMGPSVRRIVYQNYLIYYRPHRRGQGLDILRILNAKQRRPDF